MAHRQVEAKVNAYVDEGIAPLVEALSSISGLVTIESCQRSVEGQAFVYFVYGETWQELGEMAERLSSALRPLDLCCGYSVTVEWFGSNDQPRAQLLTKPEHVAEVAAAIQDVA